jgi:hypothetical protein
MAALEKVTETPTGCQAGRVGHEWPNLGKSLGMLKPHPRTPPPSYCYGGLHKVIVEK